MILKTSKFLCLSLVFCFPMVALAQQRLDAATEKRAQNLLAKGDFAGAIAIYESAIDLSPKAAAAYIKRGIAFRLLGELDKAIQDFDKAMTIDPKSTQNDRAVAEAYMNHGQIQLNNLRPEDGIVDFEKALRINPKEVRPYFDRGEARILIEDFAGAIADFNTYLAGEKRDPFNRALAVADRSLAKHHLGRDDEAKRDIESMTDLKAEWKEAMLHHTSELEARLLILRHLRAQEKKAVA